MNSGLTFVLGLDGGPTMVGAGGGIVWIWNSAETRFGVRGRVVEGVGRPHEDGVGGVGGPGEGVVPDVVPVAVLNTRDEELNDEPFQYCPEDHCKIPTATEATPDGSEAVPQMPTGEHPAA